MASLDVDQIADLFEGKEGDTERQNDVRQCEACPGYRSKIRDQKVCILEIAKHDEIEGHAEKKPPGRPYFLLLFNRQFKSVSNAVIDQDRGCEQRGSFRPRQRKR